METGLEQVKLHRIIEDHDRIKHLERKRGGRFVNYPCKRR